MSMDQAMPAGVGSTLRRLRLRLVDRLRAMRGSGQAGAVTDTRFGGDDDRETEWVPVYRASNMHEALVVRGALEAADLPVLLHNRTSSALGGMTLLSYVDVQVPRTLVDRAEAVLAGNAEREGGPESRDEPESEGRDWDGDLIEGEGPTRS